MLALVDFSECALAHNFQKPEIFKTCIFLVWPFEHHLRGHIGDAFGHFIFLLVRILFLCIARVIFGGSVLLVSQSLSLVVVELIIAKWVLTLPVVLLEQVGVCEPVVQQRKPACAPFLVDLGGCEPLQIFLVVDMEYF